MKRFPGFLAFPRLSLRRNFYCVVELIVSRPDERSARCSRVSETLTRGGQVISCARSRFTSPCFSHIASSEEGYSSASGALKAA